MIETKQSERVTGWYATAPVPGGGDRAQRGWKLHLVDVTPPIPEYGIRYRSAACGLRPAHGWSFDLFIEEECKRCRAALTKEGQS